MSEKFVLKTGEILDLSGHCDSDVERAKQFFALDNHDRARNYLKEFGAWDEIDLADDDANLGRVLWLTSGDIQEKGTTLIG